MKRIISTIITICFYFNGLFMSFGAPIQIERGYEYKVRQNYQNLSASSRFQPPVLVEWDEVEQDYRFYEHTEKFKNEFQYKSQMAYLTALFGQFLREQENLQNKDLNMSEQGLKKRFDLFRELLIKKKDKEPSVLPDLQYSDIDVSNSLRIENNKTIWVPGFGEDENEFYFYCFYLRKTMETEPYLVSLPVGPDQIVVCRKLGPFYISPIKTELIGIGTKPSILFDIFRHSIFEWGSEVSLKWNKEVNSRSVIDFFRYLNNDIEGYSEKVKRDYFKLMLINIYISTAKIDIPKLRGPLVDFLFLDNKNTKNESLQEYFVLKEEIFKDKKSRKQYIPGLENMVLILKKIKSDFREEQLDYKWLSGFQDDIERLLVIEKESPSRPEEKPEEKKDEIESFVKRGKTAVETIVENMEQIIEGRETLQRKDLAVLREMELKIKNVVKSFSEGEKLETANEIVDIYTKKLWTDARRKKAKYLFPTSSMIETSVIVKDKTGRNDDVIFLMELLFESIEAFFAEGKDMLETKELEALRDIEVNIENIAGFLMEENKSEIANEIVDIYAKKLWTGARREKAMYLFPTSNMIETSVIIKDKTGRNDDVIFLMELLFESIETLFKRSSRDDESIINNLYAIEGTIDRILTFLVQDNNVELADMISDKYISELWNEKMRKRSGYFLPGNKISRLIAAIKFARTEYKQSCDILEERLKHFNENKECFMAGSLDEFEMNSLLQLGEGYFRLGKMEEAEKTFNKLKNRLEPIINSKGSVRSIQYLLTRMVLFRTLRDICLIKNDLAGAIDVSRELDMMIAGGNVSLSSVDATKIVDESVARIDLSMRLWGKADNQEKLEQSIDEYRNKIISIAPDTNELRLYSAWRAFKENRMEEVRENLETFSGEEEFDGKEYVVALQLSKVAANYYQDTGDQETADRMVDIGQELMKDLVSEGSFNSSIMNNLRAVKEGHEKIHQDIIKDLKAKKYMIDDIGGIISLLFLKIPGYKKEGKVPSVFTKDGKVLDIYDLILKLLEGQYKAIAYECEWQIPAHREILIEMLKELCDSGWDILSFSKKLNVMYLIWLTKTDNSLDKWILEKMYKIKTECDLLLDNGKKNKGGKKNKRYAGFLPQYLKGVEFLIEEIKLDFTARDRFEEAKRYLSQGDLTAAQNEAQKGLERSTIEEEKDEELEIALKIISDIPDSVAEAEEYYSAQRFIDAKGEYETIQEDIEAFGITPPAVLVAAIKKAQIMAEAESEYLLSKDKKAVKIASKVKDSVSNDFRKKIKRISAIDINNDANKKDIEKLKSEFPYDGRIGYIYQEYMRIQKKNRQLRLRQKQLLKEAKSILVRANGNGVDELCEAIAKAAGLVGFTKEINNFLVYATEQYGKNQNNIEALKLLEKTKEMVEAEQIKLGPKLESLRQKYSQAVEKEAIDKKKQFGNKVLGKAGTWMKERNNARKLKNILEDLIRVYRSNVLVNRARKTYLRMLEIAYIEGFYADVIEYAGKSGKYFGNEDIEEFKKLTWKARAKERIATLEKHFNILDHEVKGEALSIKRRKYYKTYDSGNNDLQYTFDKAECNNGKIIISDLYYYLDEKDKNLPDRGAQILDCIMPNESYMMFTENEKGEKKELFLDVYKRDKDSVIFEVPFEEERGKINPGEVLMAGRLIRVSDPSLLRRRNKLGEYMGVMENCIEMGKMPSTGHRLQDIALEVSDEKVEEPEKKIIHFKDVELTKDRVQRSTVEACVNPELPFHLIQGPPGTGKTRLTVELIRQFYQQRKRVLVVSQSNPGIDNLGKDLLELQNEGEDIVFARIGNEELVIDEDLRDIWNDRRDILQNMYADNKRGCVVLGTTNGFPAVTSNLTDKKMREYYSHFDVVIVEEAGRATLAETMYPISWVADDGKIILVGDHDQLPAYGIDKRKQGEIERELVNDGYDKDQLKRIFSNKNINMYKTSLFQMLWESNKYFRLNINKHFLKINRRSHWAITRLVSELFYDSKIKPDPERIEEPIEEDTIRIIDYDRGKEPGINEKKVPGSSAVNLKEAYLVVDEVDRFLSQKKDGELRYGAKDITVITPYELQTRKIIQLLETKAIINGLKSQTVFEDKEEEVRRKMEVLETFLYDDPEGYDQKVIRAIGKLKRDRKKRKEDIDIVLAAKNFQKLNNKYSQRKFTYEDFTAVRVANVDSIQGSQNKVIILSLVRSNTRGEIGFLGTKDGLQRLNVAFSRAQEKFTLIGDLSNTLCQADPKIRGKWNRNIEKAAETFNRTIEIYEDLYSANGFERKDIGGKDADNRTIITPLLKQAIMNGSARKLVFAPVPRFYKPRYINDYFRWDDDIAAEADPFLTGDETRRLEKYLTEAFKKVSGADDSLSLKDISIGVLSGRAYINPSSDESFSLVHAGTRTATIWFGEFFLKEMLKKDNDPDTREMIEHEVKHITDIFGADIQHREEGFEDLKYRLDARAEEVRGRNETVKMLDTLSEKSSEIEDVRKLIIGIDLSWVPRDQGLNIIMSQIRKLSGKDNIIIKTGEGKTLAAEIESEIKDEDFSNVIVIGSEATINDKTFNAMKNVSYENRAFFAQIDPKELAQEPAPGEYNYIRLIEMINISLALAFKDSNVLSEIRQLYPGIVIRETLDPKVFLFVPKAKPIELKELNEIYRAQSKIIFSA